MYSKHLSYNILGNERRNFIFQFPFMSESRQTFCAKRFFNLSQAIFHSPQIDFPSSSKGNETWLKDA